MEGIIHELLESGGGIGETEEHDGGFEEAFVGNKGGFPLVSVFDSDIVIAPSDIELGEYFGVFEFVDEVGDQWERVGIPNSVFIKIPVVLTGTESSILFLYKEERSSLGRVQGGRFFQRRDSRQGKFQWQDVLRGKEDRVFRFSGRRSR